MGLQKIYGSSIAISSQSVNNSMEWSDLVQKPQGSLDKLWLGLAFLLVAALAYEAGSIRQGLKEVQPVVIEVPSPIPARAVPERQSVGAPSQTMAPGAAASPEQCAFVGSKNSNKYHVPTSRCARQIKTENRVCFASAEAASARGYVAGCLE